MTAYSSVNFLLPQYKNNSPVFICLRISRIRTFVLLINKLTFPDGESFYLDVKDGKRGYNFDPTRGADTFVPFSSKLIIKGTMYVDAQFHYNGAYHWHNVITRAVTFSVENEQASIIVESGEKNINTVMSASIGCVRSKLMISSVEMG